MLENFSDGIEYFSNKIDDAILNWISRKWTIEADCLHSQNIMNICKFNKFVSDFFGICLELNDSLANHLPKQLNRTHVWNESAEEWLWFQRKHVSIAWYKKWYINTSLQNERWVFFWGAKCVKWVRLELQGNKCQKFIFNLTEQRRNRDGTEMKQRWNKANSMNWAHVSSYSKAIYLFFNKMFVLIRLSIGKQWKFSAF